MPSSDYATTGGGLKLKGTKDARVDKKKKKKSKPSAEEDVIGNTNNDRTANKQATVVKRDAGSSGMDALGEGSRGKTEAERRHEEMRRKRLDDRLKKEGIKTHKERVEELNKYLSGLSEHHDMPRIGPG